MGEKEEKKTRPDGTVNCSLVPWLDHTRSAPHSSARFRLRKKKNTHTHTHIERETRNTEAEREPQLRQAICQQ